MYKAGDLSWKIAGGDAYFLIVSLDDNYKKNPCVQFLEGVVGIYPYTLGSSASIVLEERMILYQSPDELEYLWYRETDLSDIAVSRSFNSDGILNR